jgi:hypothetical protein
MKRLLNFLSFLALAFGKSANLILGIYWMYQAGLVLHNPGYTNALIGIVLLFLWLDRESDERRREQSKEFDELKSELREKLMEMKRFHNKR